LNAATNYGALAGFMCVVGGGLGVLLGPLMIIVQNSVSSAHLAVATATAGFARTIGGALGVTIYGTILVDYLTSQLPANLQYLVNLSANELRQQLADQPTVLAEFLNVYKQGVSHLFVLATVPLLVGGVCALFIQYVPLRATVEEIVTPGV
jgi:hypothetical protein